MLIIPDFLPFAYNYMLFGLYKFFHMRNPLNTTYCCEIMMKTTKNISQEDESYERVT